MPNGPGPRHYLSVLDLSAAEMEEVLATAARLKGDRAQGIARPSLAGKTLAMVFQKPSLRTRVSFEAAMAQLGGHAVYLGPDEVGLGRRETVEDVALGLSRLADLVVARVFGHAVVEEMARHATVPVINGLSDREHPCQILGDLLTIRERRGRIAGVHAVFRRDGNNVAHYVALRRRATRHAPHGGHAAGLRAPAGRRRGGRLTRAQHWVDDRVAHDPAAGLRD